MGAAFGFSNDFVDNSHLHQVFRRYFQSRRGRLRFRCVAPHNGCAALGRNHRVKAVFEDVYPIPHGNRERSPRTPFTCDRNNDRNRKARHFAKVSGDRFRLSALFGADTGIGTRSVDKRKYRSSELGGQLHDAERLAVALRLGLSKVTQKPLLRVAAFLVPDNCNRPAVEFRESRDQRFVVAKAAVAVQFDKVRKKHSKVVQGIWPLSVSGNLRTLPGSKVAVKLLAQLRHLLAEAFQLRVCFFVAGEMPQLLDILFQTFYLAPMIDLRNSVLGFVLGFHRITRSIACSPIQSRIAAVNSGHTLTRCSTCIVARAPSGEVSSSDTWLEPR